MSSAYAIQAYSKPHQRRRESGSYIAGQWQVGSSVTETIKAAVFTSKGSDLLFLPEGQRSKAVWTAYSLAELRGASEDTGQLPDELEINGQWFAVIKVWDRSSEGQFYKALLERSVERSRSVGSAAPVVDGSDWH